MEETRNTKGGEWWKDWPWRMVQTNLREIDMEDMDAEAFAEELASYHATVVNLNAAGIIASYDSKLAYHPKSAFLKGSSLKEVVEACHQRGIKVIARCDFSKIGKAVYEEHPDWAYVSPEGKIMEYNGVVQTCVNGAYQQEAVFDILRELFTTHDFDGLYCNMASPFVTDYDYNIYGPCHCENCKRLYEEQFHSPLPEANNPKDPSFGRYMGWISRCAGEQKKKLFKEVKAIRGNIAINGFDYQRSECNQDVDRPTWLYQASANARRVRGAGKNTVSDNASVDFLGFCYRHSSVSSGIMAIRQWQSLAYSSTTSLYWMSRTEWETVCQEPDEYHCLATREYIRASHRLSFIEEGEELAQGLKVLALPGHTMGLIGLLAGEDTVLCSDALKNRYELWEGLEPMSVDRKASAASLERICQLGRLVYPGHDCPLDLIKKDPPSVVVNLRYANGKVRTI